MGCVPRPAHAHPGTLARQPAGQALDQCGAAQFLSDELLLEIPSDERAHCSQKHKGGNSHPNGGFESVIHVHREPPKNAAAGRDGLWRHSRPALHAGTERAQKAVIRWAVKDRQRWNLKRGLTNLEAPGGRLRCRCLLVA